MSTTQRDAPLPCPFCGHVGLDFQEGSTFRWLEYSCGGCGVSNETRVQTLGEGTPEEWREQAERDAIKQWNTRAALAQSDAGPVAWRAPDGALREDEGQGEPPFDDWTPLYASPQEAQPQAPTETELRHCRDSLRADNARRDAAPAGDGDVLNDLKRAAAAKWQGNPDAQQWGLLAGLWVVRAMDMREALELIAAPMRPDGTWNRDREACRELAAEALGRYDDDSKPPNVGIEPPRSGRLE